MKKRFWKYLQNFEKLMKERFEAKEKDYADTWAICDIQKLRFLLDNQCRDWRRVASTKHEEKELIDLANRAFTVWLRIQIRKNKPTIEGLGELFKDKKECV